MKKIFERIKKISTLRIAFVLFIALEISFSVVAGVFARYQTGTVYVGVTSVSTWNYNLKVNGYPSTAVAKETNLAEASGSVSNLDANAHIGSGIAVGSAGYMSVELDGTNTQVSSLITVTATFLNLPTGFTFTDNLGRTLNKMTGIGDFVPVDTTVKNNYNQGTDAYTGTATRISYDYYFSYDEITTWTEAYTADVPTLTNPYIEIGFRWRWGENGEVYDKDDIYCEIQVDCTQILNLVEIPAQATKVHFVAEADDFVLSDKNTLNVLVADLGETVDIAPTNNFYLDKNGLDLAGDTYNVTVADDSTQEIVLGTFRRESDYSGTMPTATVNASGNETTANCHISDDFACAYTTAKAYNLQAERLTDDLNTHLLGQSKKQTPYDAVDAVFSAMTSGNKTAFSLTETNDLAQGIADAGDDNDFILWDSVSGLFVYMQDGTYRQTKTTASVTSVGADYSLFRFYNVDGASVTAFGSGSGELNIPQTYSVYLAGTVTGELSGLHTGLDVGDNTDITEIVYTNSDGIKTVLIRTNSLNTTLEATVNEVGTYGTDSYRCDSVTHYGIAKEVILHAAGQSSYHEYGRVAFLEIKTGKIVLEETAKINTLNISATGNGYNAITIAKKPEAAVPARITRDAVTVSDETLLVTVQEVYGNDNGVLSEERVYVYTAGSNGIANKSSGDGSNKNNSVLSALGNMVIESTVGENIVTEAKKQEAVTETTTQVQAECEHVYVDETCIKCGKNPYSHLVWSIWDGTEDASAVTVTAMDDYIWPVGGGTLHRWRIDINSPQGLAYYLSDAFNKTQYHAPNGNHNKGNSGTEAYVFINFNLDLNNVAWTPINEYGAEWDFQNHYVKNLSVTNLSSVGFFSVVDYVSNANFVYSSCTTNVSEAFAAVIAASGYGFSNCMVDRCTVSGTKYTGAVVGDTNSASHEDYLVNCCVKNSTVTSTGKEVGGLAGFLYMSGDTATTFNITDCTLQNVSVSGAEEVGGIVGRIGVNGENVLMEDNTLTDVTLSATDETYFGHYYGRKYNCNITENNNTFTTSAD